MKKLKSKPEATEKGVNTTQDRISKLTKQVDASLVERTEEVYLAMTAIVGRLSALLVGPPGCAKSLSLEAISKSIFGARYFYHLIGRFSEPDELFGPIDIPSLKLGKRKRVTARKMPEAEFCFLDEFFKCSTAIAGTLLRITNEKLFDDGDGEKPVPLLSLFAASNEWPQDGEVTAMFDRFDLRKEVLYVDSVEARRQLWDNRFKHAPEPDKISLEDLATAYSESQDLAISIEVMTKLEEIVEGCIKEGIHPSDRRQTKLLRVVKAFAYVCGGDAVKARHLSILKHVLWSDPGDQARKCAKIVDKIANPIGVQVTDLLQQAESVAKNNRPGDEARGKLLGIMAALRMLPQDNPLVQKALNIVDRRVGENAMAATGVVDPNTR